MNVENLNSYSYDDLLLHLNRLQEAAELEKVDERLRLEAKIKAVQNVLIRRCEQEASRLCAIGSYDAAIDKWYEIQSYQRDYPTIKSELARLQALVQQQQKSQSAIRQISKIRDAQLRSIAKPLIAALNQPESSPLYADLLEQVEDLLLAGPPDVEGFMLWWEAVFAEQSSSSRVDLSLLAERIKRGEMVLFIGSGFEDLNESAANLASRLAKQIGYEAFQGSFSSIAEYYQLHPEFGQAALLRNLSSQLPKSALALYQSLAKMERPLILISAAYDNWLEASFTQHGKRYVELTSIVKRSQDYDIGHILLHYSDKSVPAEPLHEEALSELALLEQGYSIIYKIRGTCSADLTEAQDDIRHDALTLSESNYFSFARYADRIIPNYLARQWRNRDFLFVAYRPKNLFKISNPVK